MIGPHYVRKSLDDHCCGCADTPHDVEVGENIGLKTAQEGGFIGVSRASGATISGNSRLMWGGQDAGRGGNG